MIQGIVFIAFGSSRMLLKLVTSPSFEKTRGDQLKVFMKLLEGTKTNIKMSHVRTHLDGSFVFLFFTTLENLKYLIISIADCCHALVCMSNSYQDILLTKCFEKIASCYQIVATIYPNITAADRRVVHLLFENTSVKVVISQSGDTLLQRVLKT